MLEYKMHELSEKCVKTHDPKDIIKHLREEMHELDLAFDRWERNRGSIEDILEETIDVKIDLTTFLTLLSMTKESISISEMLKLKLNKFQKMIEDENEKILSGELIIPINRYHAELA